MRPLSFVVILEEGEEDGEVEDEVYFEVNCEVNCEVDVVVGCSSALDSFVGIADDEKLSVNGGVTSISRHEKDEE